MDIGRAACNFRKVCSSMALSWSLSPPGFEGGISWIPTKRGFASSVPDASRHLPIGLLQGSTNNLIVDQHVIGEEGGQVHVLLSSDTIEEEDLALAFPEELLHALEVSLLPPHALKVKAGSPVVALKSLPPYVVNGTRLIVVSVEPHILRTVIVSGPNMK